MTANRRAFLAGSGAVLGSTLAGCTGFITGDEALELDASVATVAESNLDDAGYEENKIEDVTVTRQFEVADQTREVKVTNWHSQYDRSIDVEPIGRYQGAVFGVLTTPKVEFDVVDKSFNPVGDMNTDEIIEMVQDQYEEINNAQQVGKYDISILGETATTGEYEAEAEVASTGETVDVTLHVTEAVESGDDFALCIAAYPTQLLGEDENVETLMRGIEHGE